MESEHLEYLPFGKGILSRAKASLIQHFVFQLEGSKRVARDSFIYIGSRHIYIYRKKPSLCSEYQERFSAAGVPLGSESRYLCSRISRKPFLIFGCTKYKYRHIYMSIFILGEAQVRSICSLLLTYSDEVLDSC
jgi:hypothetical protein